MPWVVITDTLKSYGMARRALLPRVEPQQSRYVNNRAVAISMLCLAAQNGLSDPSSPRQTSTQHISREGFR